MSGLGLNGKVWLPSGLQPARIPLHVGNAGVRVISMRGAPVALPSFATAQFRRSFDYGRAIRCMLPLGSGRFLHLVVLYGYQGADTDAEQLALTEQLFDAALGELGTWPQPSSHHSFNGVRLHLCCDTDRAGIFWRACVHVTS